MADYPLERVAFFGALPDDVTAKDVIIALCSLFENGVLDHAIEFTGPGLKAFPLILGLRYPTYQLSGELSRRVFMKPSLRNLVAGKGDDSTAHYSRERGCVVCNPSKGGS